MELRVSETDWSTERGIASEANFDRFVKAIGGQLLNDILRDEQGKADYFFD